ncbi:hypothetical protein HY504_03375 [Candidatus Wolfebacteria bacterium]|nr:hypothetical protein [Candidatus Wolfebacteria bacterium]
MAFLYLVLYAVLFLIILKSILFWIYLWQIKEYRLDRFLAEYGSREKIGRFWLWSGGRTLRRPRFTLKATFLFFVSLATFVSVLFLPSYVFLPATLSLELTAFIHFFIFYFLIPLIVALAVFILKIPTNLMKAALYRRVTRKREGLTNLLVIGITGSYGKSSTKEFVAQILTHKFKVIKTPDNVNTEIGIANWFLNAPTAGAEIAVVEMGAYTRGEIKRSCEFMRPHIGILTGISEQHLALFGSLDNIKKAKFELVEDLARRKTPVALRGRSVEPLALFNGEDPAVLELAKAWTGKGIIYRYPAQGPERKGWPRHYAVNLEAAIEIAQYLGITDMEIGEAIKKIKFTERMIRVKTAANGTLVIEDTYSANPDGVLAALDYLREQDRKHKIVIMPSLIELGAAAAAVHERIGVKIFAACDLAIITTPEHFEGIRRGAGTKAVLETEPAGVRRAMERFMDRKLHRETVMLLEGRLNPEIVKVVDQ